MITIISGTNRKQSEALLFAKHIHAVFQSKTTQTVKLLALEDIPHDWFHVNMYESAGQMPSLAKIQEEYMLPAEKFLFVLPEYNGSFPGVVKLFLDACSIREYKKTFSNKKAALVGIASGRAGNLRGMDHLAGILNHVGTTVLPNKLPISGIKKFMDENGKLIHQDTLLAIEKQAGDFILF